MGPRAPRRALRMHEGESLPDGEGFADATQRLHPAARWWRHVRGAGVGIVLAVPAMLIAHALVAKPSGSVPPQPSPSVTGASRPAVVANGPAAPRTVARPRASSRESRLGPGGTDRRGGPPLTYATAREAAPARTAVAIAAGPPRSAGSPVSSVIAQPAAAERSPAPTTEFGFER